MNNNQQIMIKASAIIRYFENNGLKSIILHGVSLDVPKGQFLAIMGRSGAGKSTLLYQLSLLDKPNEGDVFLDGVETTFFSEKESTEFRLHNLGYVFQEYALIPDLSAAENVMVPLIMMGHSRGKARKIAESALTKVLLAEKMNSYPSQLSGGEQQRISIARAIAHEPVILFADEPTANLDSKTGLQVIETFRELNKAGQTIVMVTHEEEYGKMADRVIHLSDGRIVDDSSWLTRPPESAYMDSKEEKNEDKGSSSLGMTLKY